MERPTIQIGRVSHVGEPLRMSPTSPDSFQHFAAEYGLRMTSEMLYSAPRDVLHPPAESDQAFLVTLRRNESGRTPVRLVFLTPLSEHKSPTHRDILWWLAADAWALREANGSLEKWAASHGYPSDDSATERRFDEHSRVVDAVRALLGKEGFDQLLALHSAEVSLSEARHLR